MSFSRDPAALVNLTISRIARAYPPHILKEVAGGGAIQIYPYTQSPRPDPGGGPHGGNPYLLCPSRLFQQQDRALLAPHGDPGEEALSKPEDYPAPPAPSQGEGPHRVRRAQT